jgi:hypothetical protein
VSRQFWLQKPRAEPFQARAIGLCLVGRHPIPSGGGYFSGPGLNASFRFGCPRFARLALACRMSTNQLTNELLNSCQREVRRIGIVKEQGGEWMK